MAGRCQKIRCKKNINCMWECIEGYKNIQWKTSQIVWSYIRYSNDLNSKVSSESFAESIINLAILSKTKLNNVSISLVIIRTNTPQLHKKKVKLVYTWKNRVIRKLFTLLTTQSRSNPIIWIKTNFIWIENHKNYWVIYFSGRFLVFSTDK